MAETNIKVDFKSVNKINAFRKYVREECRNRELDYPNDTKLEEWMNCHDTWDVERFMKDYTEKNGVFRDPFEDFKAAVLADGWHIPPTDEEMRSYVAETNSYNVKDFVRWHTINGYDGEAKTILLETLKLKPSVLVSLWNEFIEESALYGQDSYIYTLAEEKDIFFLKKHMDAKDFKRVNAIIQTGVPYLQWFALNDGDIHGRSEEDIKTTIAAYWSEIYERILLYPSAYNVKIEDGFNVGYFDDVVMPVIAKKLGYKIDVNRGTIEKIN